METKGFHKRALEEQNPLRADDPAFRLGWLESLDPAPKAERPTPQVDLPSSILLLEDNSMQPASMVSDKFTQDLVSRFTYIKSVLGEQKTYQRFLAARQALLKQVISESVRQHSLAVYHTVEQQLFPNRFGLVK